MVLPIVIVLSLLAGALVRFHAGAIRRALLEFLPYTRNGDYIREMDARNTHGPTGVVVRVGSSRRPTPEPLGSGHLWLLREGEGPCRLPVPDGENRSFQIELAQEACVACVLVLAPDNEDGRHRGT